MTRFVPVAQCAASCALLITSLAACGADDSITASNESVGGASGSGSGGTGNVIGVGGGSSTGGGSSCVADSAAAKLEREPVDIILVVDTSNSMNAASTSVEANINTQFAAALTQGQLDYRVIAIADYGPGSKLCVDPPLGGAPCAPQPPATPANTTNFFQYSRSTGSSGFLGNVLSSFNAPDPHGAAPGGWSDWLRAEALKVFVSFSDTEVGSDVGSAQFDQQLLALSPKHFGDENNRNYVFHSIIGLGQNSPKTAPWLPGDPLVKKGCTGYGGVGPGIAHQQLSILTGGLRFPICEFSGFDAVFQQVAKDVINVAPIACTLPFPEPPAGTQLDPNTLELDYTPGGGAPAQSFKQVKGPADCSATAFYVENQQIQLCPDTCTTVQSDSQASLDIRSGCDVGFVK